MQTLQHNEEKSTSLCEMIIINFFTTKIKAILYNNMCFLSRVVSLCYYKVTLKIVLVGNLTICRISEFNQHFSFFIQKLETDLFKILFLHIENINCCVRVREEQQINLRKLKHDHLPLFGLFLCKFAFQLINIRIVVNILSEIIFLP